VESGQVQVCGEISNAGYQWRFLAAAMGVPFMPVRTMLGTDTLKHSSAKVIQDPWSGKPIALMPACYPDVTLFHVHRCDMYGNAQIDGITIEDFELARATRRLVMTTEEIIDHEEIQRQPWRTVIPFYLVDAVVEVPYGSYPGNMPYLYFSDEEHLAQWMKVEKDPKEFEKFLEHYIYGVSCFEEYLERCGGLKKMKELQKLEILVEK
jgi:hypothetical protein